MLDVATDYAREGRIPHSDRLSSVAAGEYEGPVFEIIGCAHYWDDGARRVLSERHHLYVWDVPAATVERMAEAEREAQRAADCADPHTFWAVHVRQVPPGHVDAACALAWVQGYAA